MPFWLLRGRAVLKRALAERIQLDASKLPYRQEVVDLIRQQKGHGCQIVLATANDLLWARPIANHLGLFDDVLASDGQNNLKGEAKLIAIQAYCRKKGFDSFAYMGDSLADIPIWTESAQAYVVAPSRTLLRRLRLTNTPWQVVADSDQVAGSPAGDAPQNRCIDIRSSRRNWLPFSPTRKRSGALGTRSELIIRPDFPGSGRNHRGHEGHRDRTRGR